MSGESYHVTVHHPTSGAAWDMDLDGGMTPNAIVQELIEDGHLARVPEGYEMGVKGGDRLQMDQSLEANKVPNNAQLQILPFSKGGREGGRR